MKHWILLLTTAIFFCSTAQAQETRTPIAGWKSIQTEHFEIIFPPGAESQAQRAAASLEAVYEPLHLDSRRGRRLPVVLSGDGAMRHYERCDRRHVVDIEHRDRAPERGRPQTDVPSALISIKAWPAPQAFPTISAASSSTRQITEPSAL